MSDAEAAAAPYRLPLFPLALVLFPGARLPLHIFEPRYRALLADVQAGGGRFGVVLHAGGGERDIPAGHAGCTARVLEAEALPDGRSNVLVEGTRRFTLARFVEADAPYHVAEVLPLGDRPTADPAALAAAAARARAAFARVWRAARTLAGEGIEGDEVRAPALDADDAAVAFDVAAAVDFDLPTRQAVLASRDAVARTTRVADLLERALPDLELRAATRANAKSNGRGPHAPPAADA